MGARDHRWGRRAAVVLVGLSLVGGRLLPALASWADAPTLGSNTFSTATLEPPANLQATASCSGLNRAKVVLSWSASSLADGYDVYRGTTNGGPYALVTHVTGTGHTDDNRSTNTTYYYVIQATRNLWTSANSTQSQATTPVVCL